MIFKTIPCDKFRQSSFRFEKIFSLWRPAESFEHFAFSFVGHMSCISVEFNISHLAHVFKQRIFLNRIRPTVNPGLARLSCRHLARFFLSRLRYSIVCLKSLISMNCKLMPYAGKILKDPLESDSELLRESFKIV